MSFNNNAIHRVNPIELGYRDVINIRVKPTLVPAPEFADPKWTTSYDTNGIVERDPERK